jgi:hypothetical protein
VDATVDDAVGLAVLRADGQLGDALVHRHADERQVHRLVPSAAVLVDVRGRGGWIEVGHRRRVADHRGVGNARLVAVEAVRNTVSVGKEAER